MKSNKKKGSNKFKEAVDLTPDVQNRFEAGLQALKGYSKKIELTDTTQCSGSLDIDSAVTAIFPQENRWDYCFCYRSEVFFVEVHSANTGEVTTVLRKLQWLKDWLNTRAPEINALKTKRKQPYYWIQSNNFNIPKTAKQYRQAVQAGLKPIPKLSLN